MRKYKIIEEKRPSEDFTRWIPMVTNTITKSGVIVDDPTLWEWKLLPYGGDFNEVGYCKNLLDAQKLIDGYENYQKVLNGDFIVNEIEYKPKQR
ncbi:MAG: hypothetical protein GTO02_14840 [Candidatus Dadabacteria bacterium]|nr:hypothetical protein [Candidatus Dadabacteria bacterium]NIQ15618.1 hypothetical protein [Candidatus Dadabacteria bacterium]